MADESDNLVLKLLREMRDENRGRFDNIDNRLDTLEKQMMGVSSILMLIRGEQLDLDERVEALEALKPSPAE